jgi:hypothetical protein
VQPCFFISAPPGAQGKGFTDLSAAINAGGMTTLRETIRAGGRGECKTCVCSMWRAPDE